MRTEKIFFLKFVSVYLAINLLFMAVCPPTLLALTAGPGSPEFSSFEPVATTDMVNLFSGDLTYNLPVLNIPGPDGGGYAMSLSYHSGANIEEEASWVGFGWTLNPGAINRNTRGFPDDYKAVPTKQYNKNWPNWTVTAQDQASMEFFSKSDLKLAQDKGEKPATRFPSVNLQQTLRYNNYQGFNRTFGVGVGYKGALSLNTQFASSGVTFSASVSVAPLLNKLLKKISKKNEEKKSEVDPTKYEIKEDSKGRSYYITKDRSIKHAFKLKNAFDNIKKGFLSNASSSSYGLFAFESFNSSPAVTEYKGYGLNFGTSAQINPSQAPVGFEIGFNGTFQMQYNEPSTDMLSYGYMNQLNNSHFSGERNTETLTDYYVEKESGFDQRDVFIGIPFPNYDIFSLTGEGLSGGFRMFNLKPGHNYPNFVASDVTSINTGVELMVGANLGVGLNFGVGNTKFSIKDWGDNGDAGNVQFANNGESVLRFNNDMGGKVEYTSDANVHTARLKVDPNFPMIKGVSTEVDPYGKVYSHINGQGNQDDAKRSVGRSSYINSIKDDANDKFTGFDIVKEDGSKYKYGQPVYAKNEIQVGVDVKTGVNEIVDNKFVYKSTPLSNTGFDESQMNDFHTVVGSAKVGDQSKYATSFLLSEITTADFVDLTGNGATEDDFGGWTRFEYRKVHDNYRWKTPYTGLNYEVNDISREKDDMGFVSTGEKEVQYLKKIETKTHIAYFITNMDNAGYTSITPSGLQRKDGLSADISTNSNSAKGAHRLERLEKIVLVSKARPNKPIKIVNFDYSYELVPNVPNNEHSNYPLAPTTESANSGKLTLKKVWFEYEGVYNARISPYEFFYRYKDKLDYSDDLKDKYALNQSLVTFFNLSDIIPDIAQNPSYSPYSLDAWGCPQPLGQQQSQKMRPWRYQGDVSMQSYDPAAYQLKQIKLPSGGEILVEYEEKDYRYVQDRDVMSMVSLSNFDDDKSGLGENKYSKEPWYMLNLADIGVTTSKERNELLDKLEEYFITNKNRIYFKFLFQLKGDNIPSLNDCRSQYIDGYAKVKSVSLDGTNIKITLDGDSNGGYDSDDENYALTPRQGCYDFYASSRVGKYSNFSSACESDFDAKDAIVEDKAYREGTIAGDIINYIAKLGFAIDAIGELHGKILDPNIMPPIKATVCRQLNKDLSYLKIPINKTKKGGGVRVKTLLTLDNGIESGDAGSIYGSVYYYQDKDGKSSGVATNEPGQIREENPLVTFIPKGSQTWLSRHTVGKDKEQSEGPIGESLLPPASIGHSRVVVESIHQGPTGDGFAIHTFNTCKDYAYDKMYSYTDGVDANGFMRKFDFHDAQGVDYSRLKDNTEKDKAPINAGLFSYNSKKFWMSQGFRFILNNMHGQPKSIEKYSGTYDDYISNQDKVYLAFAQEYIYFEPGEKMRVLSSNSSGQVVIDWENPGKEMDLTMEMKSIKERTMDFMIEVDLSIGLSAPPPPFITIMPGIEFAENIMNQHATSKVVNYPSVQKAVKVYQDGVWASSEYLAFDKATGQPILTRTQDIYDQATPFCSSHSGSIYSLILPAHWYYEEMGQKAGKEGLADLRTNQIGASAGTVISYGLNGNPIQTVGDNEVFSIPTNAVIDAKAQTFAKGATETSWFDSNIQAEFGIPTTALGALNNIYRANEQYVYKTDVTAHNSTTPIYNAGLYSSYTPFNYTTNTQSASWIMANKVMKYSPFGMPIEEEDALGIPSSAKYGYSFTMPIAVASNAEYSTIYFQDFETASNVTNGIAHSGNKSQKISSSSHPIVSSVEITQRIIDHGAIVRLWLKSDTDLTKGLKAKLSSTSGANYSAKSKFIARTGEWSLYEFEFSNEMLVQTTPQTASVNLEYNLAGEQIYIDDIKFQPKEAQVSCFVYDPATLRSVAQFDDQHFAVFFQYNEEGKLVRKIIETERGMKTVQETQYNTPKVSR